MKKIILVALLFLLCISVTHKTSAQYVTIPDANFVAYLQTNFGSCMSGSQLDTTCAAVLNATSLNVSSLSIANLTGAQYFKGLDTLICSSNSLTSLPALPGSITYLDCSYNQLSSMPSLPASLIYLNCLFNQLTSLPTLPATLRVLLCYQNHLTHLPA